MEITAETIAQQLELQAMYRDDQFAGKLKELQTQYKQTQNAQKALDQREKDLKAREALCEVIQNSQTAFTEQAKATETKILEDQQYNQQQKDRIAEDRKSLKADRKEIADQRAIADDMLKQAENKLKSAKGKETKADNALKAAEEAQAKWEARLIELGLKPAA